MCSFEAMRNERKNGYLWRWPWQKSEQKSSEIMSSQSRKVSVLANKIPDKRKQNNNTFSKSISLSTICLGLIVFTISAIAAIMLGTYFLLELTCQLIYDKTSYMAYMLSQLVRNRFHKERIVPYGQVQFNKNFKCDPNCEIYNRLSRLKTIDTHLLIKRLAGANEAEKLILRDLFENFDLSDENITEILMGAHVYLVDGGMQYYRWLDIPHDTKKPRISCHPSDADQYCVRGPLVKELLFSKIKKGEKAYTWFQLENSPLSFRHALDHTLDYIKYRMTGKQQGPYGSSHSTHHKPIEVKLKKLPTEVIIRELPDVKPMNSSTKDENPIIKI